MAAVGQGARRQGRQGRGGERQGGGEARTRSEPVVVSQAAGDAILGWCHCEV